MSAKSSLLTVSQDEINWARQNSIFIAQQDHNAKMYNAEKRGLERGMQQGLQEGEHNAKIDNLSIFSCSNASFSSSLYSAFLLLRFTPQAVSPTAAATAAKVTGTAPLINL